MKKTALHELADYYSICQKFVDPEERSKALTEWMAKQPANVQRMITDSLPALANIGKRIAANRGASNAR